MGAIFLCFRSGGVGGCGGVKTPPYGAKDTWAVMERWRAGHARPLRGATNGVRTRGAREGGSPPPLQWAGVAREWMATQGPSESPSHLTVTALRARTPLSLRDISPHCGESPFDKGAFFPCGGSGALGGAQRAPPVCYANPLVRLFAPQGQTLLAPQFRCAQLWPRARNPATPDSKVEEGAGALRTKSNTAFV